MSLFSNERNVSSIYVIIRVGIEYNFLRLGWLDYKAKSLHSMLHLRFKCRNYSLDACRLLPSQRFWYHSTTVSPLHSLSAALLGRARSVSAEHAQLSKHLASGYDIAVARKLGELSTTAKALENWELAQNVGLGFLYPRKSLIPM